MGEVSGKYSIDGVDLKSFRKHETILDPPSSKLK